MIFLLSSQDVFRPSARSSGVDAYGSRQRRLVGFSALVMMYIPGSAYLFHFRFVSFLAERGLRAHIRRPPSCFFLSLSGSRARINPILSYSFLSILPAISFPLFLPSSSTQNPKTKPVPLLCSKNIYQLSIDFWIQMFFLLSMIT